MLLDFIGKCVIHDNRSMSTFTGVSLSLQLLIWDGTVSYDGYENEIFFFFFVVP